MPSPDKPGINSPSDNTLTYFPSQKVSRSKKNEKWAKDCINAGEHLTIFRDNRIRETQYNKRINYNLANDVLDMDDMMRITNPLGLSHGSSPAKIQNYPIANPKIDLLIGEEAKRRFDWRVRVINDQVFTSRQEVIKSKIIELVADTIKNGNLSEEQLNKRLRDIEKYVNYEYKDMREVTATHILKYLYKTLNLKTEFNRGFQDALIAGEEIYRADIISGEPVLRKVNPLNLYILRSGESPYIEDADIIVEEGYYSPGMVIDDYYDYLTEENISYIENGNRTSQPGTVAYRAFNPDIPIDDFIRQTSSSGLIEVNTRASRYFGGSFDEEGNVRVVRVCWKSMIKVGKLTYYDEEGNEFNTIVDESYKPNKEAGEEVEWIWISEWWEGTKIGEDIYVKIQPRPIQFRRMDNISHCGSGYVGTMYNINDSRAKSLMDRMKPYQYLYNVFMYRTELAFSKAKGKIGRLDLSQIPDGWEVDKWLYYAEMLGWAVQDPFKEGNKGAATGKIAGNLNQSAPYIDMEIGNYIQQHVLMLNYIEEQIGQIAGVSRQRQGSVDQRELVGNVERAVTQSAHITEKWFLIHDNVKLRAMEALLETAKYAWKTKTKKLQYILDDMSQVLFEVDGPLFNESEYGLVLSNSSEDAELLQSLKQLAHAGLQNDKLNFSVLMDIYHSDSISEIRRKIEKSEEDREQKVAEQMQAEQDLQRELKQLESQDKQIEREGKLIEIEKKAQEERKNIQLKADLDSRNKIIDADKDGIPDTEELEKIKSAERIKKEEFSHKEREADKQRKHEKEENEKDRKHDKEVVKLKPKPKNKP